MKILFVSNLFPDATEPNRGIYNARLVHQLTRLCEMRVISPRPTRGLPPVWRPRHYDAREEDAALAPAFPAAAYIPKWGSRFNHLLMAQTIRHDVLRVRKEFAFDAVLVSWLYPDACAVAKLAEEIGFPFVAVAQGSDAHQYLQTPVRRRIITAALNRATGVVTRSRALADLLRQAGVANEKLQVIYNGVDGQLFKPGDPDVARRELGLANDERLILFVGNLVPIKNPLLLVAAHAELIPRSPQKKIRLMLIGDGPLRDQVRQEADACGAGSFVTLAGAKTPVEVSRYMQAADVLCVSSDDEGVPNVILEAFACGLRVAATNVGGNPEVLDQEFLGRLVERRNVPALASALAETLAESVQKEKILQHARQFSWERSAVDYLRVLTP